MRGTILRIGATGAGALLALGLFAAPPAGADGSDKQSKGERSQKVTCFNPEDHTDTQGRSLSDPDGPDNGGTDKPGCDRGSDALNADRDGNNGCGNDDDREDDNNGNCGGPKAQRPSNPGAEEEGDDDAKDKDGAKDKDEDNFKADEVDADVQVQAAGSVPAASVLAADASATTDPAPTTVSAFGVPTPAAAETTTPETQVLGETLSAPDALARTGAGIGGLALLGGLLFGGGRLTVLARRFLRIG